MTMNQKEEMDNQEEMVTENQSEGLEDPTPQDVTDEATGSADGEAKLQQQLAEAKDKYIRLYSEFENFRRRTSKEKLDLIQTAGEQLIKQLLPVIDDFERAEKAVGQGGQDLEGFILIQQKLKKILDQNGVKVMPLEAGADFDADTQEAITQIPVPDEKLKGKIVDVIEKGYLLNDKVIRYAKVVVGN